MLRKPHHSRSAVIFDFRFAILDWARASKSKIENPKSKISAALLLLAVGIGFVAVRVAAAESETMAERTLKRIVERQKELFASAAKEGDKVEQETFRAQFQSVAHEYELLLQNNPNFAAGF